ncbi:MAG: 2-succinyl-5-enolpyruvyl-6-hydroxy-3-cyclohexene-1-carboxylic-acid synthase [Puniceicoccales bacterium]|jgi:2-succinyl-5-enolpyruvyl-6-hydroxy-3-cyclohexene-1-carboxylate synthase|nr:2-succinyl-5-enolpyruvyl-6-hydroxy-3-cyclohexene-1-carboxylic-acid synthase [Puniceicoccales bacterium]
MPVLNTSTLWGRVFARALARFTAMENPDAAGSGAPVLHAFISPGSRSTPLAAALAAEPSICSTPVLDERTAAFLALGAARRRTPALAVCTSGTAAANYLPAIVEAWHSQAPLLVATADRPPSLRGRGAGQTIVQNGLYGVHTVFTAEAPLPSVAPDAVARWVSLLHDAWLAAMGRASGCAASGPAHINIPFEEPLAPVSAEPGFAIPGETRAFLEDLSREDALPACLAGLAHPAAPPLRPAGEILEWAKKHARGVIVAGAPVAPRGQAAEARAAIALARSLGWPLLADVLHPARHRASPGAPVVAAYDTFLRIPEAARSLCPSAVIQLGQLPTSRVLRQWLADARAPTLQISPAGRDFNPLHSGHTILPHSMADYVPCAAPESRGGEWLAGWLGHERAAAGRLADFCATAPAGPPFEGAVFDLAARILPDDAIVFLANSMCVRDAECFWPAAATRRRIACNRGVNGIDGTLGTAIGLAFSSAAAAACAGGARPRPVFLFSGDLAFLHDSNALACARHLPLGASLTVFLLNNCGGGIFDTLPVSRENPHFERFWGTPQHVDFQHLCAAHGVPWVLLEDLASFSAVLAGVPPPPGLRVFELRTSRKLSAGLRRGVQ